MNFSERYCPKEISDTRKYIYAGNRLLANEENGNLYFYHLDRLGSPIMITNNSGSVVKEKKYEAFGNLVSSSGTYSDNREFTSKEKDPTGFHYFGARYYSGDIGRFLSPDPLMLLPGNLALTDPQILNPYVYCTNDPLYYFDPDALYRVTVDNMVYRVTFGRGTAEFGAGFIPTASLLLTLRRRLPGALTTEPDDIPYPSAEIVTGEDWVWAVLEFVGGPVGNLITLADVANTINEGDIDKICMGMFAHAHPEAKVEGYEGYNRLDLNKVEVYKNQKNGADAAKIELAKMKEFVGEIRQGKDPKSLIESGGGEYPDNFLEHYGAVCSYPRDVRSYTIIVD